MKTLKKHILQINPKYMKFGTANWYKHSDHLSKYYRFTDDTTTQLKNLDIPTIKACYALKNIYSGSYVPMLGNLIRIKDVPKVKEYFTTKNFKNNPLASFVYTPSIL
jgi:hypothetical protein